MKRSATFVLILAAIIGAWWWWQSDAPQPARVASPAPMNATPPAPTPAPALVAPPTPRRDSTSQLEEEIVRLLRQGDAASRDRAINFLLPQLIAQDALAAVRLVEGWPAGPLRDDLLQQLARLWAATDVNATAAWLTTLRAGDRQHAATATIAQVAQTDPAGAIRIAEALGTGVDDGGVERIVQLWTEESPGEAIAWVRTRPADLLRDRLVLRIAHVRSQKDPTEARQLITTLIAPGAAQAGALRELDAWLALQATSR